MALAAAVMLAGCASSGGGGSASGAMFPEKRWGASSQRVATGTQVLRGGGGYKLGKPYMIDGRWYVPRHEPGYDKVGVASWYGSDFHGRRTANGEIYDMNALTAAHPTLPMPSYAYVTNLDNGRTVLVRVNDRGPYVKNRLVDLSQKTAAILGYHGRGLGRVRVRYAGQAPLNGDDSRERRYLASQGSDRGRASEPAYAAVASRAPRSGPERSFWSTESASPSASTWTALTYRNTLASR